MDREQSRVIATQHAYWKKHDTTIMQKPLDFPEWLINNIRYYENKGADITLDYNNNEIKIAWPDHVTVRTFQDLEDEFYNEYWLKFNICTLPFEENAGIEV